MHLRSTEEHLAERVQRKSQQLEELEKVRAGLEQQRERGRYFNCASDATTDEFITAEKQLHTTIALHEAALKEKSEIKSKLLLQLKSESKTVRVLEEALSAQSKYNEILLKSLTEALGSLKRAQHRAAETTAHRETLLTSRGKLQRQQNLLSSAVQSRTYSKSRSQQALHDWDIEALRLQREAAFSKRMYLNEVEHGREQELFLQQLLTENRKLKLIAASRHVDPAPSEPTSDISEVAPNKERHILESVRSQNMQLLQQVVSTMNLIQQQVAR